MEDLDVLVERLYNEAVSTIKTCRKIEYTWDERGVIFYKTRTGHFPLAKIGALAVKYAHNNRGYRIYISHRFADRIVVRVNYE